MAKIWEKINLGSLSTLYEKTVLFHHPSNLLVICQHLGLMSPTTAEISPEATSSNSTMSADEHKLLARSQLSVSKSLVRSPQNLYNNVPHPCSSYPSHKPKIRRNLNSK